MIYHIWNLPTGAAYCGGAAPRARLLNCWADAPAGKHRACLRCVRKLNRLRINARVPAWMVPRVGVAPSLPA